MLYRKFIMQVDAFKFGEKDDAYFVILEVAKDLRCRGIQYWNPDYLDQEKLFKHVSSGELITGYVQDQLAGAMILTFHDPEVWPEIAPGESSFIHKLSVLPNFQGHGVAKQIVDFADSLSQARGVNYTRLDCGSDRPKLCSFYEKLGYEKVGEKLIGSFPSILYQRHI